MIIKYDKQNKLENNSCLTEQKHKLVIFDIHCRAVINYSTLGGPFVIDTFCDPPDGSGGNFPWEEFSEI